MPDLHLDVSYVAPLATDLPTGVNLFEDPLLCDPVTCLDSLNYCATELVERKYPLKVHTHTHTHTHMIIHTHTHTHNYARTHTHTHTHTHAHTHTQALPVLWVYWYTSHHYCRSPTHTLLCQILKLRALTQLHLISLSLSLLGEVLAGRGVPQPSSHHDTPSEPVEAAPRFSDCLSVNHPSNSKARTRHTLCR